MEGNGKYISILEASQLSGKHIATIYRAIRKGKINAKHCEAGATQVKKVRKADVTKIFGIPVSHCEADAKQREILCEADAKQCETLNILSKDDIRLEMKGVIEEYFLDRETQLMKPLEEMATYKLGKIETENKFLKERLETVLEENNQLHNNIKTLPGPVEEINEKIKTLYEEKENIKIEKINLKEVIIQQKEHFQAEEKDYFATIGELKKQLEEEQNKSWWQKLWQG